MVHKLNKKGLGSRLRISGHASPESLYRLDIQYESYRMSHVTFTSGELCFVQYRSSLRVLPTIFDPTLKTHFFLTDGARPNSFFLLKQLTQKLYADSISADSTLTSGSSEQLKIKTSNAIGFRYRRAEGS